MTKDEALKLALEALTGNWTNETECEALHAKHMESITAIKEALAQPVIDKSAAVRIATSLGWEPKRKPRTIVELQKHWQVAKVLDMTDAEISFPDYVLITKDVEALHGIKE